MLSSAQAADQNTADDASLCYICFPAADGLKLTGNLQHHLCRSQFKKYQRVKGKILYCIINILYN